LGDIRAVSRWIDIGRANSTRFAEYFDAGTDGVGAY